MYCTLRGGLVDREGVMVWTSQSTQAVSPVVLVKKWHYVSYPAYFSSPVGNCWGPLVDLGGEYLFRSSEPL